MNTTGQKSPTESRESTLAAICVDPAAICESSKVGEGTRIWPFAYVMDGAALGPCCVIGAHACIEGGARLGQGVVVSNHVSICDGVTIDDNVQIGSGAIFTNDRHPRNRRVASARSRYSHPENWLAPTRVQQGATIGAGAVIQAGVNIGRFASIEGGAVVTEDVPSHRIMTGNPAEIDGWACHCGGRLTDALMCPLCDRQYDEADGTIAPRS